MSLAKQLDFLTQLVARITGHPERSVSGKAGEAQSKDPVAQPATSITPNASHPERSVGGKAGEAQSKDPVDLRATPLNTPSPQPTPPATPTHKSHQPPPSYPPSTPPPLRGEDESLTARCRDLLHTVAAPDLAARVRVRWNSRMRSTAGTAYPGKALITLNPRLREFGDDELDRTLRHELAHLLAHHRAGRRRIAPHGREWRRACEDLGLTDERRCHDLPLPRRQMTARHVYRCPHCATELRRVRPLRTRSACLACCRQHNHGCYDDRFRFTKLKP